MLLPYKLLLLVKTTMKYSHCHSGRNRQGVGGGGVCPVAYAGGGEGGGFIDGSGGGGWAPIPGMDSAATLALPPLPTAMIPLPLDPNYMPQVLSSYPNTPPTTSSGYSTAGHSRSSSPMTHLDGLLPLPQPSSGYPVNPNYVFAAASHELSMFPQPPTCGVNQYVVHFHINPGVSVSFTVGGQSQIVKGPMTVPLVTTNSSPPIPLPMQVPPGHVVQQIVDESGTLRHVIVSHQPPLMPIPSYGPSSQSQQFYPSGPTGYPNAHFHQPMQAVPCGLPSPHQGPPSGQAGVISSGGYPTSVPPHAQKNERTERQYVKLRRKFDMKQQSTSPSASLAPSSFNNNTPHNNNQPLRKDTNMPVLRKSVANGGSAPPKSPANGGGTEEDGSIGSTGSVTSTGTQEEEDESRSHLLSEMLSAISAPSVSEVTARSAYVGWSHPDRISESGENRFPDLSDVSDNDFRYEVFICDKSKDGRFRSIFQGSAVSCRVKDLRPGSLYAITYCAILGDVKGNTSNPASFTTLPAEPDPPASPKPVSRSRSTIQLKWSPPLCDNGSKITNFILEYDEGKGGNNWVEVYSGRNKQFMVSKLQPAYSYQFRLAAVNEVGKSRYSSVMTAMTAGSPPSEPNPPTVVEAGVTYLRLEWQSRDTDDEYCLQMDDPASGYGFVPVYNGSAPHYLCIGLKRNTDYRFRLRAQNEEGHSKFSEEVKLSTLPDRPDPPHKPTLKGRVHSHGFKVKWEGPGETGGVPLTGYVLEIDQGNGGWEELYRGLETEFNVDRLSPGQSYALRVTAVGPGGESDPSETCVITTEPVAPGSCHIPRIQGKPKSNSVHLKWNPPDWDGGSPVLRYEVGCTTPDNLTQEAYSGKETECVVNRLLPGRAYLFQIRAFNRIGSGPWSPPLEVISGAGPPDAPPGPKVTTKTSHIVLVTWTEPLNNGSAVTEYRVQMASPSEEDNEDGEKASFSQVYLGTVPSCEVKGLTPASLYLFRVQAWNGVGSSDWSLVTSHLMPASSPSTVTGLEAEGDSNSIELRWRVPADNGSPILHYNVLVGDSLLVAHSNSYVLDNLMPDTHYRIRVQAVNSVGPGAFSSSVKVGTKPLPPLPPRLECVSTAHFWMKLRWVETGKTVDYLVQMINPYKDEFEVVYRGPATACKVSRLQEDTEYQFRICSLNAAGQGPFSDLYTFATSKAPPSQVKGCKSELVKEDRIHRFEWFEVECTDPIEYQLQVAPKRKESDFKTVYRGPEKRVEISHDDLIEGMEYICRVCAVRMCGDGSGLVGPYSNLANFRVPLPTSTVLPDLPSTKAHSSNSNPLSDVYTRVHGWLSELNYETRCGIVAVLLMAIVSFLIIFIIRQMQ